MFPMFIADIVVNDKIPSTGSDGIFANFTIYLLSTCPILLPNIIPHEQYLVVVVVSLLMV